MLESITPYWTKVEHIKASNNSFSDALSRLPSKTEPMQEYIERYTQVKLRPAPLKGKIRVIRALGIETMDLATASIIQEANTEPEYINLVE